MEQQRDVSRPALVRSTLVLSAMAAALVLVAAACGAGATQAAPSSEEYGVVPTPPLPVTAPAAGFDPGSSLAAIDGSMVVTIEQGELRFADGGTAEVVASLPVSAGSELRAVAADGTMAALMERSDQTSRVSVIDVGLAIESPGAAPAVDTYDLEGLVEPEAFSTDGGLLFVIDHQVASEPGAYRVRPLDLATGQLETILGPLKVPFAEDMNGTGRRQTWSPDGTRLYTLYIRQTHHHHDDGSANGHGEAGTDGFVHVLDLDEEWAFCLDLPPAFGGGELTSTALAVSPDGEAIAVADAEAGMVAFASTSELRVTGTADLPAQLPVGELHLALTDDHLVLAGDDEAAWFDRTTLAAVGEPESLATRLAGLTTDGGSVLAWTDGALEAQRLLPPTGTGKPAT